MKDIFQKVAELRREGKTFALATIISALDSTPRTLGTRMIVYPDSSIEGTIGGGALEKRVVSDAVRLLAEGKSKRFAYDLGKEGKEIPLGMICGGKVEVLIESFCRNMKIFIFGAGHVGKKLAELCSAIQLPYWIIDSRKEFAREGLFPDTVGVLHTEYHESFTKLPIDEYSYLIIVTHGHEYDGVCLEAALTTKARYIGMIGSKNKVRTLLESLSKKGVNVKDRRIYAPIGLHLGDSSPEQISISILAEILKIETEGSGKHLRESIWD
jgi:xanthine dehydrogenase accessory factor